MKQRKLVDIATAGPAQRVETIAVRFLRIAPAAACTVKQIVADKTILARVAVGFRKGTISGRWNRPAAIRKTVERDAHHRYIPSPTFGSPHAAAKPLTAHPPVDMMAVP